MGGFFQRFVLWAAIFFAIALIYEFTPDTYEFPRRPLPPSDGRAWLSTEAAAPPAGDTPTESIFDLWIESDGAKPEDSLGTAFLIAPGTWVTAAHVLESCRNAHVRVRNEWRLFSGKTLHPAADVAVATSAALPSIPFIQLTDRPPVLDQDGFQFGYPQGEPGSIHTRLIGLARVRQGRPGTRIEQGWVWAEQGRTGPSGHLGGISGGPQVDRTGAVQSITVASTGRGARLTTAPISRAREILAENIATAADGGTSIDPKDYDRHGDHVRDAAGTVSLVFCAVSSRSRPKTGT